MSEPGFSDAPPPPAPGDATGPPIVTDGVEIEVDDRSRRERILGNLFAPVDPGKILIKDERIIYAERRHWARLLMPMLETLTAFTFLATVTPVLSDLASAQAGINLDVARGLLALVALGFVIRRLRHGRKLRRNMFVLIAATVAGFIAFGPAAIALAVIVIGFTFLYKLGYWYSYEVLFLTNRRIILANGLLGSDIEMMPLTRVTDLAYHTTALGDVLGYATLRVESAGQTQALARIRFLHRPEFFYETLIDLTTSPFGGSDDDEELTEQEAAQRLFLQQGI